MLHLNLLILVKGAGDLGTGVAWRLHKAGLPVVMTELAQPLAVRRAVAFANTVYVDSMTIEGVTATFAKDFAIVRRELADRKIPVCVDPDDQAKKFIVPTVLVDAVMAKRNTGTRIGDAPLVIALGPGFTPQVDCHAVVETNRGHYLGRVDWDHGAEPNTGMPGEIGGRTAQRVLYAPCDGVVAGIRNIGDKVAAGEPIAKVGGVQVLAPFDGILRGLIHQGIQVQSGMKIGDVDPRAIREHCFTISDKSRAIGGGVLEAILSWLTTHDGE